jgi:hypothetical protein
LARPDDAGDPVDPLDGKTRLGWAGLREASYPHPKRTGLDPTAFKRREVIERALEGLYVPTRAPWFESFRSELLSFPAGKHDDQVDALGFICSST